MHPRDDARPGWPYYAAILIFIAVFAFAVLGLVRSSTRSGAASRKEVAVPRPTPTPRIVLASGPVATPQIPPPTPNGPTQPPSRTYLIPPPELVTTPVPTSEPAAQPRR